MEKVLLKLSIIAVLNGVATLALLPVIPHHIRSLGGSHFLIGLMNALFAGIQVLAGPLVGSWSDLRGRKVVWTTTYLVAVACCFIMGLTSSLYLIFLANILIGTFEHTQILGKAVVGDILPKDRLTEAYGTMGAVGTLGIIFGPILGGHLIERENGFFYVCTFASIVHFAAIGLMQTLEEKPLKTSTFNFQTEVTKIFRDLGSVNWREFWEPFFLRFVVSFAITVVFTSQLVYIGARYGLSQKGAGYYVAFVGLLGIISVILIGWIKKVFYSTKEKQADSRLQLHLFATYTIGLMSMATASTFEMVLIATIPVAFACSGLMIITMEGIVQKSTDSDRGILTGASESVMGIGRCVAPLVSGIIAEFLSEKLVISIPIFFSILGTLLCLKITRQDSRVDKID
ncbi:hypothetical protein PPYR_04539 [Photinus pyralis]|uniref:Major facilitator superfamily (MFS) profile domain-containing protein n=1 Tax=Photinus pyralis TaxID=7054 RepID=A0A1Y1JUC5_PHOPY|nr:major facilitator superfamily domain-containing protein 9-like [Photinus pyralis]KAB0802353.1 hypothetical protein PPYR_04539 [Photinus pyralis]